MSSLSYRPYGKAREIPSDLARVGRVTFGSKRTIAPGIVRARVEIAGLFNVSGARITQPTIVAQASDGSWMTWEARLLRGDEPDTVR